MRRTIRTVAVLAVVGLVAAACGEGGGTQASPTGGATGGAPKTKIGMVYDLVGRGDKSFNDAAYAGMIKAQNELHIQFKDLTPDAQGTNREALMRLLAQQGYPFIIGNGFLFADHVAKLMKEFPDVKFAVTDGFIADLTESSNAVMMGFAEHEGSFLVGAVAALKSTSGHLGFIGGVDTDLIHKFEAGFRAGAAYIKPSIRIDIKYISAPPDFSGFNDPAKGKEIALSMYQDGADIVYHAAGGSGTGLFQAASEFSAQGSKVWGIGVDSDQYQTVPDFKDFILTSMLKKVDVAVFNTIKTFVNGVYKGGYLTYDLKVGGVGYSTSGGFIDDIKSQLDDIKQKIISGEISVPSK